MQGKDAEKALNNGVVMKKGCQGKGMLISRLLDGDLPHEAATELSVHINGCGQCTRLLDAYRIQKELISASFSDKPLPIEIVADRIAARGTSHRFHLTQVHRLVSAAAVLSVFAIVSGYFLFTTMRTVPQTPLSAILESTHPSTMCVPFSSLVYYEEYAGATVHSQFVKMSPQRAGFTSTEAQQFAAASFYESPLFGDNATETAGSSDSEEK